MQLDTQSALSDFGEHLGSRLKGADVIELVGDVGAGKTTLVKAIARGMGITDTITSPSYTLSQTYDSPSGLRLVHYDFYRLDDPGILASELEEAVNGDDRVVAIEWAGIVAGVLPADHLRIEIVPISDTARQLTLTAGGVKSTALLEQLQ